MTSTATMIATMLLPLDQIEANDVALRTVDLEDPDVLMLFDNIKAKGVLTPIRVRPAFTGDGKTPKTLADGRPTYFIIDGLHRYTGAVKARLDSIPVLVVSADDAEVEKQQLMANLHRIPTKPYEYGKHLKRIIARDQTKTKLELANELNVSLDFIERRLGLNGLHADGKDDKGEPTSSIGKLVDAGKITISNASELARLKPSEEQLNFVKDAIEMKPVEFGKKIQDKIKELRDAKRGARDPNEKVGFTPLAAYRKKGDVEAELAAKCSTLTMLVKAKGLTDPTDVAVFTLQWALQLDEQSLTVKKADFDAREKERAADAAKRKQERAEKAAEEAKKAAALVTG